MHILISPNAFKNSLDAAAAAEAIEKGLQQSRLVCTTQCLPVGDGGDGTGELLTKILGGKTITEKVRGPLGKNIAAQFGLIDDGSTAVIEMAAASGLRLLRPADRNPMLATTYGTGELIRAALHKKVTRILLCVGGSATVDGGTGILQALGARFLDAAGKELAGMPASLVNLASIDLSALDERIRHCELIILCDVTNPLLGEKGSAAVFGPQKGASVAQVGELEASLTQFSKIVQSIKACAIQDVRYGGAAGGVAAGLHGLLKARLVNGIDHFLETTKFDDSLEQAQLLITGEGSIDAQTLEGKAPFGVAVRAKQKNIPVIALAGKLPLQYNAALHAYFDVLLPINHEALSMKDALSSTRGNLERTAWQLGEILALKIPG